MISKTRRILEQPEFRRSGFVFNNTKNRDEDGWDDGFLSKGGS